MFPFFKKKDEAEKIRETARKLARKAWEIGVPELVSEIYLEHLRLIPEAQENLLDDPPLPLVTDIVRLGKDKIKMTLNGKEFIFSIEDNMLKLSVNSSIVLQLNGSYQMKSEAGIGGVQWAPYRRDDAVIGFIDGDWVKDLLELQAAIRSRITGRIETDQKKLEKIQLEKMKKNFGI